MNRWISITGPIVWNLKKGEIRLYDPNCALQEVVSRDSDCKTFMFWVNDLGLGKGTPAPPGLHIWSEKL